MMDNDDRLYYDRGSSTCLSCSERDHAVGLSLGLLAAVVMLAIWACAVRPETRTVFGYQRHVIRQRTVAVGTIFKVPRR